MTDHNIESLIVNLYRAARETPFVGFQDYALRALQPMLDFNTALWGLGMSDPRGGFINCVHLHELPPVLMVEYEGEVQSQDPAAERSSANVGRTVMISLDEPVFHQPERKVLHDFMVKYGFHHTLCTASFDATLGLSHFITVCRGNPAHPWQEAERLLMERLFPHLVEAYVQARSLHLEKLGSESRGHAILDRTWTLLSVTPAFRQLMLLEWPTWTAWRLPGEVEEEVVSGRGTGKYIGRRIIITFAPDQQVIYVTVRRKNAVDTLSRRELAVATLFARGITNKAIAKKLGVSPNTVRNQIKTVYLKLEVNSKVALAACLGDSS